MSAVSTVLFFHAHPDDEAIFTALTMRRLADDGHRVVLVTATGGELGVPLFPLGRRDSGMPGHPANRHRRALARARVHPVAAWLAELADAEGATAIVHY